VASVDGAMVTRACQDCVCVIPSTDAVSRDGKAQCCDACADGHVDHDGCDHDGCTCHG
jgi:metallothionein